MQVYGYEYRVKRSFCEIQLLCSEKIDFKFALCYTALQIFAMVDTVNGPNGRLVVKRVGKGHRNDIGRVRIHPLLVMRETVRDWDRTSK